MDAAIIELDALADPVGAAAEDDTLRAVARLGFAFRRVDPVALIGRVHIRGQRREFGGAGVDALIDRMQLEASPAARRPPPRRARRACASRASEKPICFSRRNAVAVLRQPVAAVTRSSTSTISPIRSRNHGSKWQAAWISAVVSPWR